MEEIQKEKARRRLIDFTLYTMKNYQVNWHHRNIANVLDKWVNREIKRLMIFCPPRHGKSELVSRRLPAFIFGRNPDARIIATSYSGSLAMAMCRDVQRIMDSPEYSELFPHVKPGDSKRYIRTSEQFEIIGYKGHYFSAGVGGGITGYGADYAIIDDPIKNREEAESLTYRNKVYDWFTSTLYTRLEKDACILITLTRWHQDDLAGRLLRLSREDPEADQWHIISYPAIFDERLDYIDPTDPRKHGEALWPEKYDEQVLATTKATIGSYQWSALYQQSPSPPQGNIFKREWFKYYKQPPTHFDEIIQSWDFTFKDAKSSDYVAGGVWGRKGADKYLLDVVHDRMDFVSSVKAIKELSAKWPQARAKIVEDRANGPAIINLLKHEISGLIPWTPTGSKIERAYAVQPQFEAGNVYIPDPSIARWVRDYVEEMVNFPSAPHDDFVDMTTQALIRLERTQSKGKITVNVY